MRCCGDEDRSTQSLRRQALSQALVAPEDVLVDLADLAFADPSLMLDLAMIARRLRKSGRKLTLRGAQPDISVLIEYVGLHRLPGVAIAPAPRPPRPPGGSPAAAPGVRSARATASTHARTTPHRTGMPLAPAQPPPEQPPQRPRARSRSLHRTMALALVLIFIVVPIAELYVLIQIGSAIGILPTIALLILDSVLGAALMRSQGRAAWMRFNRAVEEGRVPGREVIDGVLVIFGGALLLTPGFISDFLGLILLLPPTTGDRSHGARAPLRRADPDERGERRAEPHGTDVHVRDGPPAAGVRRRRRRWHGERCPAATARAAVSVSAADEAPRTAEDPAFRDAVTFSFGDPAASVYGLARVGVGGAGRERERLRGRLHRRHAGRCVDRGRRCHPGWRRR